MPNFDGTEPLPENIPEPEFSPNAAGEQEKPEPQVIYTHDEESLRELREEVAALRELFTRRLMEDRQKSELIRNLSDAANFAFLEPFLYDLILLLDRLDRAEDEFSGSVRDELFEILQRRGLELIKVKREFDPKLCKAVRVNESADAAALTVTGVVRRGYTFSGKVIRPAEVVVTRPAKK